MNIIKRFADRGLRLALDLEIELNRSLREANLELCREVWRLRRELEAALRENAALRAEQRNGGPNAAA